MSKHTPGPWRVSKDKWADGQWGYVEGEGDIIGEHLPMICHVTQSYDGADGDSAVYIYARRKELQGHIVQDAWANANLMAAAPELLAVAEDFVEEFEQFGDVDGIADLLSAARAAIAKARGEK